MARWLNNQQHNVNVDIQSHLAETVQNATVFVASNGVTPTLNTPVSERWNIITTTVTSTTPKCAHTLRQRAQSVVPSTLSGGASTGSTLTPNHASDTPALKPSTLSVCEAGRSATATYGVRSIMLPRTAGALGSMGALNTIRAKNGTLWLKRRVAAAPIAKLKLGYSATTLFLSRVADEIQSTISKGFVGPATPVRAQS